MVVPPSSTWKWTDLMQSIEDASKNLNLPYDQIQDLVHRLDGLNRLLRGVDQQLSPAMELAVKFPMEALVANELLMNDDINVKLSLGCCICELARITAPEPPYPENIMREVCNILITILESLSFVTGNAYTKAALVLENVARCQLFMAMWDCDDVFIVKIFQTCLHLRGSDHPESVISNMKHIITLTIKEDADVPSELFTILLHSLKRENLNVYPVSYKLAERVLQECAGELKHCVQRAMGAVGDLQNYSEIVARVLSDAKKNVEDGNTGKRSPSTSVPSEFNMNGKHHLTSTDDAMKNGIPMETSQCLERRQQGAAELDDASKVRDGESDHNLESESLTSQKNKNGNLLKDSQDPINSQVMQEELVCEQVLALRKPNLSEECSFKYNSSTNLLRACDQLRQDTVIDTTCSQRKASDAVNLVFEKSSTEEESASKILQEPGLTNSDVASLVQEPLDSQTVSILRKRGRRPNSLLKPEEGYEDSWIQGGTGSPDVPRRRRNKRKEFGDASEGSISKNIFSTPQTVVETLREVKNLSIPNKRRSKKRKPRNADDILNENGNLQVSKNSTQEVMQTVPEIGDGTCSDHNIESGNNGCKGSPQSRDVSSVQGNNKKQRSGSTSDQIGKRSLLKRLASFETPEAPSEFDKVIEAIKAKTKNKKNRTLPKEEGFAFTESIKDNEDRLVGHKIKVYWPLDEMFYTGSVLSFDVMTKKHKVIYDDGDEEALDLSSEQWELLGGDILSDNLQKQGKVADVVMLPDTSKNGTGSSVPSTKKHKVLNDAGGDHALTSSGKRRKALKNKSKSENISCDVGHATTSTGKRQKVQKRRSKLEQAKEDFGPEQMLNSNDQMLKVLENRSKLDLDRGTEIINPATIISPNSKIQGRARLNKSSQKKLQKSPVAPSSSCPIQVGAGSSGTVNLHGYQVKSSTAPILSAIVAKYGDIAANCLYKSPSFRASLLEVVCNVVQRLKDPVITASDIQSMISEISDAETAKIDVSWLQTYLVEIANEEEAAKKASDVRMSTCIVLEEAEKEFKLRQAELVAVQTKVEETKKRFEVFKHVLVSIETGILESVAKEKSWQRRLDELLSPK